MLAEHRAFHFYQPCGHRHRPDEFATRDVPGIGPTCAVGRVYTVCAVCCVEDGSLSAVCVRDHVVGSCHPCPRRCAAERALQAAGKLVPVEHIDDAFGPWKVG